MRKLVYVVLGLFFVLAPLGVFAGYGEGGDTYNLKTKLEVSKNGTDWYNYSAEENAGGQTLSINAGDSVTFRLKVWDDGNANSEDIYLPIAITNAQYIESANVFDGSASSNSDLDLDDTHYVLTSLDTNAGTGMVYLPYVIFGTSETGTDNESGTYTTKISANTPDQTLIKVTMFIETAAEDTREFNRGPQMLDRALADSLGTTEVRILVLNPSQTQAAPATTLPNTGAGGNKLADLWPLLLASSILFFMIITSKTRLFSRIKK